MPLSKSMINDLTVGSVPKELVRFSLPFVGANLLQFMYNIVDMIIVGQFVGSAGLSAVSIGADFLHFLTFIAVGFAQAGQVMIAQSIGKGDRKLLNRIIGNLFSFVLGIGLVVSVISLFCADWYAGLMNTPAESYQETINYCIVCSYGMVFVYGYNIVSNIMQGMGDSRHPLMFVAISAVINLILGLLLVGGFGMGCTGAALATVIGQSFSFLVSIVYLYRRREAFGFDFRPKSFALDKMILKNMAKLGIPMCLQSTAISISVMYVTSCINVYGVIYSAVNGVANKISQLTNIVTGSLRSAGSSMTGQNFGAGKFDRVKKIFWYVLGLSLAFAAILTVILLLFPQEIFALFNDEPEVLLVAMEVVPVIICNFFGSATRTPTTSLINGIGFAGMNFVMGMMDGVVVRIGLALLMGKVLGMGIYGYWYGSAIAGYMFFVVVTPYFLSGRWKKRRTVVE